MFDKLLLSVSLLFGVAFTAVSSLDHTANNETPTITTPVKRVNTNNFTIAPYSLNYYQSGYTYQIDNYKLVDDFVNNDYMIPDYGDNLFYSINVNDTPHSSDNYISFTFDFNDTYTKSNLVYHYTYGGYDEEVGHIYNFYCDFQIICFYYSLNNIFEYYETAPRYTYFSTSHVDTSTDYVASRVNNPYRLSYDLFTYSVTNRLVITESPNVYFTFVGMFDLLDDYEPYQRMIYRGLFRLSDTHKQPFYDLFYPNVYYNSMILYRTNSSYVVSVSSNDSNYNKSYEFTSKPTGIVDLFLLAPFTFDENIFGLSNGFNIRYYDFVTFTPTPKDYDLNDLLFTIVDTPVYMIYSLFNVDLFGVNLFYVVTGLLTAVLVFWLIRKFI